MGPYKLKIELLSPALIGSGVGFGALIDTDIAYDETGLPFVPAKRVKGLLRHAALEVEAMFSAAQITASLDINRTFGERKTGSRRGAACFSNLILENYAANKNWLTYFLGVAEANGDKKYRDIVTAENILETLTEQRQHTRIGANGVAQEHSLRTIRVAKARLAFYGDVSFHEDLLEGKDTDIENTILFACLNLRHIGTKRNRGFGKVRCTLLDGATEKSCIETLEGLCKP